MKVNINLDLSEEEVKNLKEFSAERGLTVKELMENFVSDLVGNGNGSDERDLAYEWADRCWFSHNPEECMTLLEYLRKEGEDVDDFLTALDERDYYKEHPDEEEEKPDWVDEDASTADKLIEDFLAKTKSNITEEIAKCREWLKELTEED